MKSALLSAHAKVNEVKQDWTLKLKLRAQARRRTSQVAKILAQDTEHNEQLLYQTSLSEEQPWHWSHSTILELASFFGTFLLIESWTNYLKILKTKKT